MTKTMITPVCLFYILMNAFSTNKRLILTIGSFSVILHIAILLFAISGPSTKLSFSPADIIQPDTVILHNFIISTIIVALFTISVYHLSQCYNRMVFKGASLENTCTQIERYFSISNSQKFLPKSAKLFQTEITSVNAAVLVTDIRDFAVMNETYKEDELFSILSGYYKILSETIFKYHGAVFGMHGDELMAVFGTPDSSDKDILNAVNAGNEILNSLESYNEILFNKNLIPVKISMG
ncbi:MAG: adenylate/guanylate cyclase domain-containing protein, partial [Spirochaetes bacterium]|nr:adenylate/guanylate cyclase domain-containing protein [Spirochaetota bacterium]